jgi:hypothetical protein
VSTAQNRTSTARDGALWYYRYGPTTRDLLALADRYSLDTEQIATFLRLVREQHPGVIHTAEPRATRAAEH